MSVNIRKVAGGRQTSDASGFATFARRCSNAHEPSAQVPAPRGGPAKHSPTPAPEDTPRLSEDQD